MAVVKVRSDGHKQVHSFSTRMVGEEAYACDASPAYVAGQGRPTSRVRPWPYSQQCRLQSPRIAPLFLRSTGATRRGSPCSFGPWLKRSLETSSLQTCRHIPRGSGTSEQALRDMQICPRRHCMICKHRTQHTYMAASFLDATGSSSTDSPRTAAGGRYKVAEPPRVVLLAGFPMFRRAPHPAAVASGSARRGGAWEAGYLFRTL